MKVTKWKLLGVSVAAGFVGLTVGHLSSGTSTGGSAPESEPSIVEREQEHPVDATIHDVAHASHDEFPGLADRLLGGDFYDLPKMLARRELIRRWIEFDPESAYFHFAKGKGNYRQQIEFGREWAEVDPEGIVKFARSRNDKNLLRVALFQLVNVEPYLVISELERGPDELGSDRALITKLVGEVANIDIAMAEYLVEKFATLPEVPNIFFPPHGDHDWNPLYAFAQVRATTDLPGAIQWAQTTEDLEGRQNLFAFMIAEAALDGNDESGEIYRSLISESGGIASKIAERIAETNPVQALEWLEKNADSGEHRSALIDLATEFHEPEDITNAFDLIENDRLRDAFVEQILINWKNRDLKAGLDFINRNATGEKRSRWLSDLAGGVGDTKFEDAYELSDRIADPTERELFRRELLVEYADSFPEKALALAEAAANAELYWEVFQSSIESHVDSRSRSVEESADLISKLPESHTVNYASVALARRWWYEDPPGAVQWVESIQHSGNRRNAIQGLLIEMAVDEPEQAIAFAETRTDPADRQTAVASLVGNLGSRRPDRLFPMTASLAPGKRRSNLLAGLVSEWARQSPDAATVAISQSSELTNREKERLLARIYTD